MDGPQFSTQAESHMHRLWGGDLIGMTCMPEAKLAREAELCYALVALPTDYDCWRPHDPSRARDALLTEIVTNLKRATTSAVALIRASLRRLGGGRAPCPCPRALDLAIWSDARALRGDAAHRLEPILDRYRRDRTGRNPDGA
jgi:5'-methylthioadenosine phosphorylase